jgi:hypothetical protein
MAHKIFNRCAYYFLLFVFVFDMLAFLGPAAGFLLAAFIFGRALATADPPPI